MKTIMVGSFFLLVANSAFAADMAVPIYKAPPLEAAPTWNGFYLGANLGYSQAAWASNSNQAVFNFESTTAKPNLNGVVGGLQFGFNRQINRAWVLGLETDIQRTNEKASQNWTDPGLPALVPPPPPPPVIPPESSDFVARPGGPASLQHSWDLPWFGTARLRAGVTPADNWLLYVTGGLAYGQPRYSFSFSQPGAAANVPPTPTTYALSVRDWRLGYSVGAGAEVKVGGGWSVKLEYLYIDLGTVAINTADIDGAPFRVDIHARDNIWRAGLNYQFGSLQF